MLIQYIIYLFYHSHWKTETFRYFQSMNIYPRIHVSMISCLRMQIESKVTNINLIPLSERTISGDILTIFTVLSAYGVTIS
jgi:calcineurin-like phosphoesterase family protein